MGDLLREAAIWASTAFRELRRRLRPIVPYRTVVRQIAFSMDR
jgi:hypothetical protein